MNEEVRQLIENAGMVYSTYISAVSFLEVGFGPSEKSDIKQQRTILSLYTNSNVVKVSSSTIDLKDPCNSVKAGLKFLYIPEEHEWYGARHKLISWMNNENIGGTSARKQANDALIFMCAWNANSFLITDNIKDFTRFNRIMYEETGCHLPLFTVNDLRISQDKIVVFPENIPNYP